MDNPKSEELKEKYKTWSNDELIHAVTINKDSYLIEAIELMTLELSNRNITPSENESEKKSSTQNTPNLRMTSLEQTGWSKFKDNYGWGWAILGYLYIKENQFINAYYGEYTSLFQLFGFGVSLGFYFLSRQKLLIKLKITWLRSIASGLIAIVLTIPLILLLELAVGVKYSDNVITTNRQTVDDPNVSKILKTKLEQQTKYLHLFAQKDKSLWSKFNSTPKSSSQLAENISSLEELIPLYKEKDSVLISTYRDILNAMRSSEKWKLGVPSLINDFQSIVDIGTLIASEDQNYLINLRNYYYSLKLRDNKENKYLLAYQKSYNEIQKLTNKFTPILLRVTGKDLTKNLEEIQKEYYQDKMNDIIVSPQKSDGQQFNNKDENIVSQDAKTSYTNAQLKNKIFLKTEIDKPNPKVDEKFNVSFVLYTMMNISSPTISRLPTFSQLQVQGIPLNNINFNIILHDGQKYYAAVVAKYILQAPRKGIYNVTSYELDIPVVINKQNKSYYNYRIKSDPISIDVL